MVNRIASTPTTAKEFTAIPAIILNVFFILYDANVNLQRTAASDGTLKGFVSTFLLFFSWLTPIAFQVIAWNSEVGRK